MTTFSGGGRVQGGRSVGKGHFKLNSNWKTIVEAELIRPKAKALAAIGEAYARDLVPVQTGTLKGTIAGRAARRRQVISAVVTVGTDYWQFVEYGTGRRGAGSPIGRSGVSSQGFKHGSGQGMHARPFMRPALMEMKRAWNAGEV